MESLKKNFYNTPLELDDSCRSFIKFGERVLDIGCGIRPQSYFKPYLHVCLEPYQEYIDILNTCYARDPGFLILTGKAQEVLESLPDESFDSVFLIDVIEHLKKDDGFRLLKQMERLARNQVLIFTPLGFMPQHYELGEKDAWGLGGTEYQEHKSGWQPEDFDGRWEFHICPSYHQPPKGYENDKTFGAFWAVLNCENFKSRKPLSVRTLFIGEAVLSQNPQFSIKIKDRVKDIRIQDYKYISLTSDISPQKCLVGRLPFFSSPFKPLVLQRFLLSVIKGYLLYSLIRSYKKKFSFGKVVYVGQSSLHRRIVNAVTKISFMQFENESKA